MDATLIDQREAVGRIASAVRESLPLIRGNAGETETRKRILAENHAALAATGVYRMTRPHRYGGLEASIAEAQTILAEIAAACPSTAWVAGVAQSAAWSFGMFSEQAQDEIFADPNSRGTLVISPGGKAVEVPGGFQVSGRWPFNTGCHGADWALLMGVAERESGPEMLALAIPYSDLEIEDDWDTTGLAGSGSNTCTATDIFVPEHRVVPGARFLSSHPIDELNARNPYYRLPNTAVILSKSIATPIGIAQGAFDAFLERLPGRKIAFSEYESQAAAPVTHLQVAEAKMKIDTAWMHARRSAAFVDNLVETGGEMTMEVRAEIRAHVSYACLSARDAVGILFGASGATAIQSHVAIQRLNRDIQALSNHAFFVPATGLEAYGRALCGLTPNTLL